MSVDKFAIIFLLVFSAVCPHAHAISPHGFLGVGTALRILWARGTGVVGTIGGFLYDLFKTSNTLPQEETSMDESLPEKVEHGVNLEAQKDCCDYEMDEMDYDIEKW